MGVFTYIARDASGRRVTGQLAGANEQSVLAELEARRLAPVRLEAAREPRGLRRSVSVRHLANGYGQLADLLAAGVPLLRGLRLIGRSRTMPRLAAVMTEIADKVADGARLADAMTEHENVFPPVQVAMVRAGERGGFLEQALARMGEFLEHQADMRGKVIGNLIYPVVLLVLSFLVVIGALVFFVPKFEPFFTRIEPPLPTRMVMGASALLTRYWLLTLVVAALAVAGGWWLKRRPAVRRAVAVWQLRIPKVGPLIRAIAVARFARLLGTLLGNGVPLLGAMQISRNAAGHVLLEEAIDEATEAVRSGERLTEPLADSGLFGEDVVEMIAVGESANNLPEVLNTIAETIEKRVDRMLGIVVRLMEPLLLMGLGGVVLFIFLALVVPMIRMSTALAGS
ncbi:MAG: type II secretion system F family protein [Planctomycetota bacterium]|jgi:general secretion pathway protein F/type IV pilus assembly protein PilC